MKKYLLIVLSVLLVLTSLVPALASDDDRSIQVAGTASVSLQADTATLSLGVTANVDSVTEAQKQANQTIDAIVAAIKKAGVADKDIATAQYNVSIYRGEYSMSLTGKQQSYEVSSLLSVTVRDLSILGEVIDKAVDAGANTLYGLNFTGSQAEEARDKALALAVKDARRKAEVLAKESGLSLGDVVNLTSDVSFGGVFGPLNDTSLMKEAAASTNIITGDVSQTATVTVRFAVK